MSKEFSIGSTVTITSLPPYVKTAEPMPMLRPAQVISVGEVGIILEQLPGDFWVVKCQRGNFLLDDQYLELIDSKLNN